MSSTGIYSDIAVGAPTTGTGERGRKTQTTIDGQPTQLDSVKQKYGIITEVHETKPLVKVLGENSRVIAGSGWIPLIHSTSEIAEKFGTIRPGMKVLINLTGPTASSANATIIGVENEEFGEETKIENEIKTSSWEIFGPGIGVG